jgi:hypothetical protein
MKKHLRKTKSILVGMAIVVALLMSLFATLPAFAVAPDIATLKNPPALGSGINLGGFSALTHVPGDPANVFYTLTDRGPNVSEAGQSRFPIPTFTPKIIKIQVLGSNINILQQISLKLAGQGIDPITRTNLISGIPNIPGLDETPYDSAGNPLSSYDPYGLDTEGIAYNPNTGTFWVSEEYRPSLVEVTLDGTIQRRLIPQGQASYFAGAPYIPISDTLPAVFATRVQNRGFESVTITPSGNYMYTAIQSPLANPTSSVTSTARVLRILKIDLHNLRTVAEYAYLTPDGKPLGLSQSNIFISDMFAIDDNTLLVDERDNREPTSTTTPAKIKNIVEINVNKATNILDITTIATDQGDKTPEQATVTQLQQAGIEFPTRNVILDLLQFGYPFAKVEGLTLVGKKLSVVNDNDFDVGGGTDPTQLWTFELE